MSEHSEIRSFHHFWPFTIIRAIFFSCLVIIAVGLITEIDSRELILNRINADINQTKSKFSEQNLFDPYSPGKISEIRSGSITAQNLDCLESRKSDVLDIIALGSQQDSLSGKLEKNDCKRRLATNSNSPDNRLSDKVSLIGAIFEFISDYFNLHRYNSDQLLAFATISCAALGAMTAAIRRYNGIFTLKNVVLGMGAGFVVFLAIKGGKHVFLMQMQGEHVAFNPYGS